ncbi:DUF3102 domain-containing protein [Brevibacillus panacihumi]|uniref:DUF3102 domain-containing protein n=1 Tax=Brevibacillus panacihumi TaxID=497735 RepID=UPI00042581F8|nr:DUF3102 domain-containing protein [Brevibacillus panacihumi]
MNVQAKQESALSNDLQVITAEINTYKRIAGESIFEIGRRLKHVKENDLAHGEWEKWCRQDLGFTPQHANKFIRVYERFGKRTSTFGLALDLLALLVNDTDEFVSATHTIPSTGETKTVDEMTVRDYEHQLRMEISENENRKEFTFSERVDWARRLERVEKEKARERMEAGKAVDPVQNFAEGRSRDIVAEQSGLGSGENYRKAKYIADHAAPEIIAQLDAEEISIHRAYQETKRKLAEAERRKSRRTSRGAERPSQTQSRKRGGTLEILLPDGDFLCFS